MPNKALSTLEQAVLAAEPTAIERERAAEDEARALEQQAHERSAAIVAGMALAQQHGIHVRRPATPSSCSMDGCQA